MEPLLCKRIQHVPNPNPPPPHSCLKKPAGSPPPFASFSGHSPQNPRGYLLSLPHQLLFPFVLWPLGSRLSVPKTVFLRFFLHWSPYPFPWPLQSRSTPLPPTFFKALFSSSLSQALKPASLQWDPQCMWSGFKHPCSAPFTNQLPPAPTSTLHAGGPPTPMPLFIFGPDAGQPARNAPAPSGLSKSS